MNARAQPKIETPKMKDRKIEYLENTVAGLAAQVDRLLAEADIRKVQARYMMLCDTPCPDLSVVDDAQRIEAIVDLYTEDAVWEGVGSFYDNQFGRCVGKDAIRKHFEAFWQQKKAPALVLNVHYLTSEHIRVDGEVADGQWVHCQPWVFSDGSSLLRSSRLNNAFRKVDGMWKLTRTRTENIFSAPLPNGWAGKVPERSVLMQP